MTTRKPRTNSFSGQARPTNITQIRIRIEEYMMANPRILSAAEIAEALGEDLAAVRKKLGQMVSYGVAVSLNPKSKHTTYQLLEHWKAAQQAARPERICNGNAPTGDTEFWRGFMARTNEQPRQPQGGPHGPL